MEMPAISIVLPVYNGSEYIGGAIESILCQTYADFELIIVNDCSTDHTLEIANRYAANDQRIRVYSNERNLKLPATLNEGFKRAKGKFYTWTSHDNLFEPGALEVMAGYLEEHDQIDLVYCDVKVIDTRGNVIETEKKSIRFIFCRR